MYYRSDVGHIFTANLLSGSFVGTCNDMFFWNRDGSFRSVLLMLVLWVRRTIVHPGDSRHSLSPQKRTISNRTTIWILVIIQVRAIGFSQSKVVPAVQPRRATAILSTATFKKLSSSFCASTDVHMPPAAKNTTLQAQIKDCQYSGGWCTGFALDNKRIGFWLVGWIHWNCQTHSSSRARQVPCAPNALGNEMNAKIQPQKDACLLQNIAKSWGNEPGF